MHASLFSLSETKVLLKLFLFSDCITCPQACVNILFYAYGFLNSIELGFQYSVVSYSYILHRSSCARPIHTHPIFLCIFSGLFFSYYQVCVEERIWYYLFLFQWLMTGDVTPGSVIQAECFSLLTSIQCYKFLWEQRIIIHLYSGFNRGWINIWVLIVRKF